jgi:hypothetical protein
MSMSAPAAISVETPVPNPAASGEGKPSRFGRLIDVVRKLIDYGRELATTLQRRVATTDLAAVTRSFGTRDIGLILARITRGLLLANALEARVVALAARPAAPQAAPSRPPARLAPRAPRPAAVRPTEAADPRLALLPTPEQIAAEVRRRPAGAVIADICRDLGILPTHPLWLELSFVVVRHGGSFNRLLKDIWDRVLPIPARARSVAVPAALPAPAAAATGPP